MEKYISCKWKRQENGEVILISDKIDSKTNSITKDQEENCIMIKGSIQDEDRTLINIYEPNTGAPKYIKHILTDIKREIDNNVIILGNFDIPLPSMDRSSRQKINKETLALNDTLDQMA